MKAAGWAAGVLDAGGEMGALVGAFDWAATPLGPMDDWPQSLRTAVSVCLTSRFPILLWWGPELVMIYNDAYRPILGASKHPVALGAPGRAIWPEIWDVIGPMLRGVMAGEGATWSDDQLLLLDRNGFLEECYFTFSYSPIVDESGATGGVFCAVTETTEKLVGARRLATLGRLAAGLVDTVSPEQACARAVDVLTANRDDVPFAEVRLGGERIRAGEARDTDGLDVAVGRHGRTVAPGYYAAPVIEPGATEPTAVLVFGVSDRRPFDDGYRSFLDLSAGHLATAISGARAYVAQQRRAQALAELDTAKTTFFSNISHELRTPLTLILGPVADALDEPLPERQRSRLELIARSAGRLRKLVNGMLDFARIEAGRLVPEPAPVDLARATTALAHVFAPAVERAGLTLVVDAPRLPRLSYLDREMWDRVVLNLLSNAVKYTLDGEIRVELRDVGDAAELRVRDTGVGIPADEVPRLFERFHRVRGVEGRTHEGSGIGLAMVAELLRLLDGTVEVESTVGEGTTFTVRVPYGRPSAGVSGARPGGHAEVVTPYVEEALSWTAPLDRQDGHRFSDRPRLLVAEDNRDLRDYLRDLLEPHYAVEDVADGAEALVRLRAQRPDMVLADVMMPRLDGFGLLAAVRADPDLRDLPVVLLSARAGEEAAAEGFAAGADDYLVKPFSPVDLRTRLRANLDRAAARSRDAAWRAAIVHGLHDGVAIATGSGVVIEVNEAFGRITGYGPEGLPYTQPYPWLPRPDADPAEWALIEDAALVVHDDPAGQVELPLRHRDGHTVWVALAWSAVKAGDGDTLVVGTVRDITRERGLRERRTAAAELAAVLAAAPGPAELLAATIHGFADVFGGTVLVIPPTRQWPPDTVVTGEGTTGWTALPEAVRDGLTAARGGDRTDPPPGLLLTAADHTVWVHFPAPRPVGADELLLAHLLADVLATGIDRAAREASRANTEENLRAAIDSHRFIGQAVGILMERHRLTAAAAFERLRAASQRRNIKLRDIADHVIATGEEVS
ncbi:ATP-binding protein [Actinokineospora fastidiosa]|uniref:ATP-binding protein n=1 Tax=Actinokineospora fastidiosa TaxID=1816 RepID=UPI00167004DC|nr:ATP-binding protein [Actinokineospora fastidiosa]